MPVYASVDWDDDGGAGIAKLGLRQP